MTETYSLLLLAIIVYLRDLSKRNSIALTASKCRKFSGLIVDVMFSQNTVLFVISS